MTSTHTYDGMDANAKPSSKVLAPPGGRSSINLFGSDEPLPASKPAPVRAQAPVEKGTAPPAAQPATQPAAPPTASQPGRNIRAAPKQVYNIITGEPRETAASKEEQPVARANAEAEEEKKEEQQPAVGSKPAAAAAPERSSTRVAQPPGGKSNWSFS